ncbi:MAG: adenylate kinase [Candidatus Margulisbacteria bacterium]|nr:adenylate kinase [Candidatus Margulisiibacteriota bacterium]MBU1616552.1 adenylate kinase [Candidatus Margulisiibacteriota bacterium]
MILVLLGPPGSGKGTQAKLIAEAKKLPHISLGDLLREEVRGETEIGKKAKEFMDSGKLVPDELTIELARKRVSRPDCQIGFIMDGFPRSAAQAEAFDQMLRELDRSIDFVLYFKISQEEVVSRLSGRRSCKDCGAVYHLEHSPPKVSGRCDSCGGELILRKDDDQGVIRTRFEVYDKSTRPLVDYYGKTGKMVEIDASLPIEKAFNNVLKILANATAL